MVGPYIASILCEVFHMVVELPQVAICQLPFALCGALCVSLCDGSCHASFASHLLCHLFFVRPLMMPLEKLVVSSGMFPDSFPGIYSLVLSHREHYSVILVS